MGKYVAKRLGVSPATYSQIESGQRDLTVQRLDTIRSILGLTWEQLLAEEDGKNGGLPATFCQEPATFCPEPATFGQESGIFVRAAPREARQGKGWQVPYITI